MFDRIGGILGLAFYGAQASALCGGFVLYVAGAEGMATAWLRWTAPPTIGLALALDGLADAGIVKDDNAFVLLPPMVEIGDRLGVKLEVVRRKK